jgi:hypothetical protein
MPQPRNEPVPDEGGDVPKVRPQGAMCRCCRCRLMSIRIVCNAIRIRDVLAPVQEQGVWAQLCQTLDAAVENAENAATAVMEGIPIKF